MAKNKQQTKNSVVRVDLVDAKKQARKDAIEAEQTKRRGKKFKNLSAEEKDALLLALGQAVGLIDDKGNLI